MIALRGELRCFSCARYLGDFESHPEEHGQSDLHLIEPEFGTLAARPLPSSDGSLRCSHCGGGVLTEWVDRVAA